MAELNFPTNPSVNDTFSSGGKTWVCTAIDPDIWEAAQDLGGANTEVLFNDSDVIGSDTGFTYDKVSNNVFIANTLNLGHASDTTVARVSAGIASIEGSNILVQATGTLTAGFGATIDNDGIQSSGTYTANALTGNFKSINANGAFTLGVPSDDSTIIVQVTNGTSAGAITTSSWTLVSGDTHGTTSGDDWLFYMTIHGSFTHLDIKALQ